MNTPDQPSGLVVPVDDRDLGFAGPVESFIHDESPKPGDLLWRYAGDGRISFTGPSAGILQLMHPDIGAGVDEHSDVIEDPWHRILRSLPEIIGTVYDADSVATGHMVRDFHKSIKGTRTDGQRYSALRPETFWWAHAAFHYMVEEAIDHYTAYPLDSTSREHLYAESVAWYGNYGVNKRPVAPDYNAFISYWDTTCLEVLEMTPPAAHFLKTVLDGTVERHPYIAPEVWEKSKGPLSRITRLITIGHLPPMVRKRFDLPWSKRDEAKLRSLESATRHTWQHLPLPNWFRYHPRAQEGTCHRQQEAGVSSKIQTRSYSGLLPFLKTIQAFPQPDYE